MEYDYILQSKMGWSKNVVEECDAPDQVLVGAMDPSYCVLLALGVHLEHSIMNGHLNNVTEDGLLFGVSKSLALDKLGTIIGAEDFP